MAGLVWKQTLPHMCSRTMMLLHMSLDGCQPLQRTMDSSPDVEAGIIAEMIQGHEATIYATGNGCCSGLMRGPGRQGRPEQ